MANHLLTDRLAEAARQIEGTRESIKQALGDLGDLPALIPGLIGLLDSPTAELKGIAKQVNQMGIAIMQGGKLDASLAESISNVDCIEARELMGATRSLISARGDLAQAIEALIEAGKISDGEPGEYELDGIPHLVKQARKSLGDAWEDACQAHQSLAGARPPA